jgi:hypothetical protein
MSSPTTTDISLLSLEHPCMTSLNLYVKRIRKEELCQEVAGISQGNFNTFFANKCEKCCLRESSTARNKANVSLEKFCERIHQYYR